MLVAKHPRDCTPQELVSFAECVLRGGHVERDGLERRIMSAASLIFLMQESTVIGVAAIKNPDKSYLEFLEKTLKRKLPKKEFGWCYLNPAYRGLGLCKQFCVVRGSLFATVRTSNVAMRKVLISNGFKAKGEYPSQRDRQAITLFVRTSFWSKLCEIMKKIMKKIL